MKSGIVTVIFVVTLAALLSVAPSPRRASACSIVPPSRYGLKDLVDRSPITAIGTWTNAGEYEATLVVDESLKGTEAGSEHKFDNRDTYTAMACSPYDEPFGVGHRFRDGQRSVVFFDRQVDGLWQIGWLALAAFDVPPDEFAPMDWRDGYWERPGMPGADGVELDEVRATVAAAELLPGEDLAALEVELGCHPPFGFNAAEIEGYSRLASAIALVTVDTAAPQLDAVPAEPVTLTVNDVFRGPLASGAITLNRRWISDYETEDCVPAMEANGRHMVEGQQYLVFLRADEFGVADSRPVAWGQAIVEVNEKYITAGAITMEEIRAYTGTGAVPAVAVATPLATVVGLGPDADSDRDWLLRGVIAAVAVALLVGGGIFLRAQGR